MELEHLLLDVSDHIATMTLNRPEARNAFSQDMRKSMGVALERVREGAGTDVKALIITGAGGRSAPVATSKGWGIAARDRQWTIVRTCA